MLPVLAIVKPQALLCATNGALGAPVLRSVGVAGQLEATCAARAWDALWGAARGLEIELTWTYGGTYRSMAQQEQLFYQRWQSVPNKRERVFYNGQYWYLRSGVARAAIPGTSNHGWGLSVDVAAGSAPDFARPVTPYLGWLKDNVIGFGWSWESQAEPWHLHYWAGDALPERVALWEELIAQSS